MQLFCTSSRKCESQQIYKGNTLLDNLFSASESKFCDKAEVGIILSI